MNRIGACLIIFCVLFTFAGSRPLQAQELDPSLSPRQENDGWSTATAPSAGLSPAPL